MFSIAEQENSITLRGMSDNKENGFFLRPENYAMF
jgi:hypothetical protein